MKHLYLLALAAALLSGCGRAPVYPGGTLGSYANADHETTTSVVSQPAADGTHTFVVAWTSERGGGPVEQSAGNIVSHIHGYRVRPDPAERAVYALQPDHSLKKVLLSDEQLEDLFLQMERPDFHTSHSELWQAEIAPHLQRVEAPDD